MIRAAEPTCDLMKEVSCRLGLALSTANDPSQAAAWVEGLLRERGALLIHEEALWRVIDDWISALPGEAFISLLPLLRRTFSTFSAPERRMIGDHAKQGPVRGAQHAAVDFDLQRAEAMLPLLAALLGLELKEGDQE